MPKFSKKERLCSKIVIEETLAKGKSIFHHPFKLVYHLKNQDNINETSTSYIQTDSSNVKIAVVVPKRLFKKAVDRNQLKRIIKEAYRLNKAVLQEAFKSEKKQISLFLIYTDKNKADFQFVETKIKVLLHQLIKRINFESSNDNS
jgi:ribonuclease P protein component